MATITGTSAIKNNSALTCTYSLTVTKGTQSIENNTTTINYEYYVLYDTASITFSGTTRPNAGTVKVVINGTTVASKTVPLTHGITDGTYIISKQTGSVKVPHNADGTKTLSYSISIVSGTDQNNYNYIWSASSKSGSMALTTIPRSSSISSLTSSTDGYLSEGGYVTVAISRASSSFTHKVEYSFGGSSYTTYSTDVDTSCNIPTPLTLATNIPNSKSGTFKVRVTTYNGSTAIGSSVTKSIELAISSVNGPTITSFEATRVDNNVPSSWGVYVQGHSQVALNIDSVSCKYGATVKSSGYTIYGHGINVDSKSGTSSVLTKTGTRKYTAVATDSRGWTGSTSLTIYVYPYSPPSISVTAVRCNSSGTETSNGTYLKVTPTFSYASVNGKNSITSKSISCNGESNTTFTSGSSIILAANCAIGSTYTLKATVTDALGETATANIKISTAKRIMNIRKNKDGIAFGKFSENADEMDVDLNVRFRKPFVSNVQFGNGTTYGVIGATGNYNLYMPDDDAGWTKGFNYNVGSSQVAAMGVYGHGSSVDYAYIGESYSNPWFKVEGNGIVTTEVVKATQIQTTGFVSMSGSHAAIGYNRHNAGWLGFYGSAADASASSNRKGWIGHNGGNNFTVNNEAGGNNNVNKAWTVSSDKRLKTNVEDIPPILMEVWKELMPKVFEWNELNYGDGRKQFGLIAQDVVAAFEKYGLDYRNYDFVTLMTRGTEDDTEYYSVTYDHYHMMTAAVVKQQQQEIDILKSELSELKTIVEQLLEKER